MPLQTQHDLFRLYWHAFSFHCTSASHYIFFKLFLLIEMMQMPFFICRGIDSGHRRHGVHLQARISGFDRSIWPAGRSFLRSPFHRVLCRHHNLPRPKGEKEAEWHTKPDQEEGHHHRRRRHHRRHLRSPSSFPGLPS